VRLWDLKEGGCVSSLWQSADGNGAKERHAVHSLAIAKRDTLAAGTWGGTVRLWDLHRTRCTATFDAHAGAVWSLLQADNKLFSAGSDGVVRQWDARASSSVPVGTLGSSATSGPLYSMAERDGLLLTGGYDQLVKVWDHRMMRCLNELPGHSGSVRTLAFLGDTLLSGSTDGTVRLWDFGSLLAHDADLGATGATAPPEPVDMYDDEMYDGVGRASLAPPGHYEREGAEEAYEMAGSPEYADNYAEEGDEYY